MAKRFTDSDKWTDKWYRKLPPKMKLLWCYMLDSCDTSGVFEVDLELYELLTGEAVSLEEFDRIFENRILSLGNDKVWIKKFVAFQYGILSEDSRPHKVVIEALKKHGVYKEYLKGIDTLKDKDKDKDKGLGKGDARGKPVDPELARAAFDIARKLYPGTKNGLTIEWTKFLGRYGAEVETIIPLLVPAIHREIEHRATLEAAKQFVPAWKHFQTWINNRCWEQELGQTGGANGQNGSGWRGGRTTRSEQLDRDASDFLGELRGAAAGNPEADHPDASIRGTSEARG